MKRVKPLWVVILTLIPPTLQPYDDGGSYSLGDIARDWTTVWVVGGDMYALNIDHWGNLWFAATTILSYRPIDEQYAITYFGPLYDSYEGYDRGVKIECNYDILTEQIKDLTAGNEAGIGNDPVPVYKDIIWIGGGYLNIIFRRCLPAKERHRFSLVRDMRNTTRDSDDGHIHLEYRYNAYGDVTKRCLDDAVSLNLNSLGLTGKKDIKAKLNSVENEEVEVVFDIEEQLIPEGVRNVELLGEVQVA